MLPTAIIGAGRAAADYGPQPGDIVGVGGDTPQFALQFAPTATTLGDAGFNAAGAVQPAGHVQRHCGRQRPGAYTQQCHDRRHRRPPSTRPTCCGPAPSRCSGSRAAVPPSPRSLADTGCHRDDQLHLQCQPADGRAAGPGGDQRLGFLHVVQIGTDSVRSRRTAPHERPGRLVDYGAALHLHGHGHQVEPACPGNSGGSADTIIPLIPPSSSSIYKTLIADLTTANGGTAPTLSTSVKTVEQNDPTVITGASTPADAIVPFSAARLNLWNDGYFHNPERLCSRAVGTA